jgi:LPS-assembly lipoprotein
MSWHEDRAAWGLGRLAAICSLAALLAGCFQPMYGQHAMGNQPGLRTALSSVTVDQIEAAPNTTEARLAVEVRNQLLFAFTGGDSSSAPTHRLTIKLTAKREKVIVDLQSQRPDMENFGLDASYTLTDVATGKEVVNGTTFARVSYDIPGQEQRFARVRGMRDAETRAAKVIADQITSRLASYFVAGT